MTRFVIAASMLATVVAAQTPEHAEVGGVVEGERLPERTSRRRGGGSLDLVRPGRTGPGGAHGTHRRRRGGGPLHELSSLHDALR